MLIIDDILLFPVTGLSWVFRQVHDAAQKDIAGSSEKITVELSDAYMMLETNQITEEEFEAREKILLDRLDRIRAREASLEEDAAEDEEQEETDGAPEAELGSAASE